MKLRQEQGKKRASCDRLVSSFHKSGLKQVQAYQKSASDLPHSCYLSLGLNQNFIETKIKLKPI